jgi:hypothetical protein
MSLISFYGQFLLKFQELIAAKVPEIRYVDRDLGQLEVADDYGRPKASLPCLLIDFVDTKFDEIGQHIQVGTPVLRLRLGFAPFTTSNSLVTEDLREKALKFWELENKIYSVVQGFDADGLCQPLTRFREASENREDFLAVRVGFYNTAFQDESAKITYEQTERPPIEFDDTE